MADTQDRGQPNIADLGLRDDVLAAMAGVFKNHPAITRAVVFGSRAKGEASKYADVDIALFGGVDMLEVEDIICDLDELPFVYTFDAVAYDSIGNSELRQHIDRVGVAIYKTENSAGA